MLGRRLSVGIVGLGTAGQAAAVLLARDGHAVQIFERTRKEELTGAYAGAGIGMQPIGLTVLQRLGVLDEILALGARVDRLHSKTREGRAVLDLRYADFREELFGLGLHRGALFRALHESVRAESNIEVLTGMEVDTCMVDEGLVRMVDGTVAGPFDLVLVADGRKSVRRRMPQVKAYETLYPWGCMWNIVPDDEGMFAGTPTLDQTLDGSQVMLGILPTGRTHDLPAETPNLVSIFWSVELAKLPQVRAAGLGALHSQIIDLDPRTESLLRHVHSMDDWLEASYSDTFMPELFAGHSCAFLGDAAHATSPQLGQGANLALVDASVLADAVRECPNDVSAAIRLYDSRRRWRLRFYQMNSRLLTPVFQSNSRVIGGLRDAIMGPLCRFPPTRLQMLTVLCGAQNNGVPWTTIPEEEFMGFLGKRS